MIVVYIVIGIVSAAWVAQLRLVARLLVAALRGGRG